MFREDLCPFCKHHWTECPADPNDLDEDLDCPYYEGEEGEM